MKGNKLLLASLAALVAIPSAVYAVPANDVKAAEVDENTSHKVVFKDVPSNDPYFEIINEMNQLGYISGYPDGTFKPADKISRKHVAALLSRVLPLEPVREAKEFKDVPKTHLYYENIQRVQRAGIMTGDQNGNFNPDAFLTRAQIAKIIDLAFDLDVKSNNDFVDISPTYWANEHVMAVYSNGVMTGYEGYFKPNERVNRAQYAVFLYNALNIGNNDQAVPHVDMRGGGYSIENVEALHSFKQGSIEKIKVTASDEYIYILTQKETKIDVEKYTAQNELIEETTCEKLDYWYEPESYASERVQLQGCSSGQKIYDLGPIAL